MCLPDFANEFVKFLEFLISSKNSATDKAFNVCFNSHTFKKGKNE